jgi:hypothetical protein
MAPTHDQSPEEFFFKAEDVSGNIMRHRGEIFASIGIHAAES